MIASGERSKAVTTNEPDEVEDNSNDLSDSPIDKERINAWFMGDCAEKVEEGTDIRRFTGQPQRFLLAAWKRAFKNNKKPKNIEYLGVYSGANSYFPDVIIVGTKDMFIRFQPSKFYAWNSLKRETISNSDKDFCQEMAWYACHISNWTSALEMIPDEKVCGVSPISENSLHSALFVFCSGDKPTEIESFHVHTKDLRITTLPTMIISENSTHYSVFFRDGRSFFGPLGGKLVECSNNKYAKGLASMICDKEWDAKNTNDVVEKELDTNDKIIETNSNEVHSAHVKEKITSVTSSSGVTGAVNNVKNNRVRVTQPWQVALIRERFIFVDDLKVHLKPHDVAAAMQGSGITSRDYARIFKELGAEYKARRVGDVVGKVYTGIQVRR